MKNFTATLLLLTSVLAPAALIPVEAFAYGCTALTQNLSLGSRSGEVTTLQQFLVSQNYPGGGSWMVSGYFGSATQVAVQNFQRQVGLSVTGSVDAATRAAIQNQTCGGSVSYNYNPYQTYPYTYTTPTTYYNTTPTYYSGGQVLGASIGPTYDSCAYYNCSAPVSTYSSVAINYLTPSSGNVGTSVSIYGTGFSYDNNTVHFGIGVIPSLRSIDGKTLSFTVPSSLVGYGNQSIQSQPYQVYVTNSAGQNSNQVTYNVTGIYSNNSLYPSLLGATGPVQIQTGTSGTWNVTVSGSTNGIVTVQALWGDSSAQSTQYVTLDNGVKTVSFSHAYATQGNYTPFFTVSNGSGSNSASAQSVYVSANSSGASGTLYLSSLTPLSGQVGTQIVLYGSGFTATGNTVHFGSGGLQGVASSNGTNIYFTIPHYVSPCDLAVGSCTATPANVTPGTYALYVTNGQGTTQTINFTVTQ